MRSALAKNGRMVNETAKYLNFVALIETYTCLYDVTKVSYTRVDIREKAWAEIAQIMCESVQTCKQRWKNIRTVFLRHHRKKTPSDSAAVIKKKYYLEEALQFLIPFLKGNSKQNLNPDCEQNQNNVDSYEDTAGNEDQKSQEVDQEMKITKTEPQLNEAEGDDVRKTSQPVQKMDDRLTGMKKKNTGTDADKSPMEEGFKAKQARQDKISESADEKFLLCLLPDVSLMNAHQKRRFKRETLELIDKILQEDHSSDLGNCFGSSSASNSLRSHTHSRPLKFEAGI